MTLKEFNTSVYPLRDKLFRFSRRLLEQQEEAEDAVQEVFIRLWNKREELSKYRSIEALAMTTTRNICLDKIRGRKYPVENMENHRLYLENIPGETREDNSDMLNKIRIAMNMLPEQQRTIMHLRDVEGYEFDEIAAVTDMNENAIRVALSRARKRIRELILNATNYEYQRN
jgi:RNA polymerase sigma-70 factor (ECF subfamily)